MIRALLRAWRRLCALLTPLLRFCPEEAPNRPFWAREAWKQARRRGYHPGGR
jgi:hypothetical protein